jgi:hypothetical protein
MAYSYQDIIKLRNNMPYEYRNMNVDVFLELMSDRIEDKNNCILVDNIIKHKLYIKSQQKIKYYNEYYEDQKDAPGLLDDRDICFVDRESPNYPLSCGDYEKEKRIMKREKDAPGLLDDRDYEKEKRIIEREKFAAIKEKELHDYDKRIVAREQEFGDREKLLVFREKCDANAQKQLGTCCICDDKPNDTAIVPCGHKSFCLDCISTYKREFPGKGCPICRGVIQGVFKIHE